MTRSHCSMAVVAAVLLLLTAGVRGQPDAGHDWPCWRGADRHGVSPETEWTWRWEAEGPRISWRAAVGTGFSSFAVVAGRVYTLGNESGTDTVFCFDADSGAILWRTSYLCDPQPLSYEGGPSATPAVAGGRIFSLSKSGNLHCLDAVTGQGVWHRTIDAWPYTEGDWKNTWRYAGSPLIQGGRLVLSLGTSGAVMDATDGTVIWESKPGHPGYASPVPFHLQGEDCLAFFSGHAVVGVRGDTGRVLWRIPWNTEWDLNAADPIIHDGRMFVSSGRNTGCALFDITQVPPRDIWRNKAMRNELNTSVLWEDHLYGFDAARLVCLTWDTGEERWSASGLGMGSLIVANGKLLVLAQDGRVIVAEASPAGFVQLAEASVLTGRCWTSPVLAHGRLYVRNAAGDVACLDLRPDAFRRDPPAE